MMNLFKNKKGATFAVWIEVILFSLIFVLALALMGNSLNSSTGETKDITFGISTNATYHDLQDVQKSLDASTKEGQSGFSSLGIFTLTTLPKMISTTFNMIVRFITGGWIKSLVGMMNLGEYTSIVTVIFTILYFLILILILIKLLTRVNP